MSHTILTTSRAQYRLDLICSGTRHFVAMYNSNTDIYRLSYHPTQEEARKHFDLLRQEFQLPEPVAPDLDQSLFHVNYD